MSDISGQVSTKDCTMSDIIFGQFEAFSLHKKTFYSVLTI